MSHVPSSYNAFFFFTLDKPLDGDLCIKSSFRQGLTAELYVQLWPVALNFTLSKIYMFHPMNVLLAHEVSFVPK